MKKVRIVFGALTRVEYAHIAEVPDDATDEEIQEYADEIYENLEGDEFYDDPHYWERGETTWQDCPEPPGYLILADGIFDPYYAVRDNELGEIVSPTYAKREDAVKAAWEDYYQRRK